jgi:hypothetical protein
MELVTVSWVHISMWREALFAVTLLLFNPRLHIVFPVFLIEVLRTPPLKYWDKVP